MAQLGDRHLSKTISWLLRHGAIKEGLNISSEGFVDVKELLAHRSLQQYTVDDLKRIVRNNDKQRFTLREEGDSLKIRANQGHSLNIVTNLELNPIENSEQVPQVIHGTYKRNWFNIKTEGLKRMKRTHIHFATGLPSDKRVISGIRSNVDVLIYIDLKKALQSGIKFYQSSNGVVLSPGDERGVIGPEYFLRAFQLHLKMSNRDISICKLCNVVLPVSTMDVHVNGKKHRKAAKRAEVSSNNTSSPVVEGMKKCNICNVFIPITAMSEHINSKNHTDLESLQSANVTKAAGEVNADISETTSKDDEKCTLCNDSFPPGDVSIHINTTKHKFLQLLGKSQSTNDSDEKITGNVDTATGIKQEASNKFTKCGVCNILIESKYMESHISGKKHQKLMKSKSDGIELKEQMVNKGANVCDICSITVECGDMKEHINGKRHQQHLKDLEEVTRKNKSAIKVTGYPLDSPRDAIVQYFRQFGSEKLQYFADNCYFVFYKEPIMAENVLSTPHYFNNTVLTVERYIPEENTVNNEQKNSEEFDLDVIARSLRETGDFNQQLNILMTSVRPEYPAAIETYKRVCYDLEVVLKRSFKTCQIHAFGSTLTGLCFKDSDVDIYVQLPVEMVSTCSSDQLLKMARKALYQSRGLFNDIVCIFSAKTPIVKCYHVPTRIKCDFNFRSMLGVCNSRLIMYYLSIDYKITQLMIVLKFWAKIHSLNGSQKFTNYALTMMLIFYLQQPPFNLPAVKILQTDVVFEQDGWNGGFAPLNNFQSEALKNTSLLELLKGFFNFYTAFEFGLYVICPLLGEKVPKMSFFDGQTLSDDFIRYKDYLVSRSNAVPLAVDTAVCIQDPFELTRNVSAVVQVRVLDWFYKCCKQSYEICNRGVENNLLYNLFMITPKKNAIDSETTNLQIKMTGSLKYFYRNLEPAKRDITAVRELWFETVNNFLLSVLTLVFKLDVDIEPEASTNKFQRLEGQKDVHDSNLVDSIVFHCTGKYNLWEQRKSFLKNLTPELNVPPNCSTLDKEVAITNLICERGLVPIRDRLVDFNLTVTARTNPTLVEFRLDRRNGVKSAFHKFCVFFMTNFVLWFAAYMHEKNSNVEYK